ncbi:mycofactocin-associated electron transfer flavoprotein beta subunit [Streptomyces sp. NPDC053560]|uniref:mycofactocin-associated electron transfer flavoprotein beta subunit n=1 Tax=Streptomyces sp. NPDC053560 TaxID=3365711 RepID=UPI0037D79AC2
MTVAPHPRPLIVAVLAPAPEALADQPSGRGHTEHLTAGASPADLGALEQALRVSEALGGHCLAVCVGPPTAEPVLREALAAGADAVLRVEGDSGASPEDPAGIARGLHAAFRALPGLPVTGLPMAAGTDGTPGLVLFGDRSPEHGADSVPAFLAARLLAAQALGLSELTAVQGTAGVPAGVPALTAVRRTSHGVRERLTIPLPAVCSVEPGEVRLRRAALPALLASRTAAVPAVNVPGGPDHRVQAGPVHPYRPRPRPLPPPTAADPRERLRILTGTGARPTTARIVAPETPAAAADALLAELRAHGYVAETS